MYKFHLNNTKKTSSKTRLGGNTFLRGQDFSFYYMFKTNFSGTQYNWGALPSNTPLGYAPACKAKVSNLDENIAALRFW